MTAELEEKERLVNCLSRIDDNLREIGERLADCGREIQETTNYMWEARRDLNHINKVAMRQAIEQKSRSAEVLDEQRKKLLKMRDVTHFGRFDFTLAEPLGERRDERRRGG